MTRILQSLIRSNSDRINTYAGTDTSVGRECLSGDCVGAASRTSTPMPSNLAAPNSRRGSALILVLVSLVMMVLIGTAYVQVARVDRRATAQLTGINNLDTVRDAVIAYMAKVLKEDLVDATGNFFTEAGFDEPFDAPFTNTSVSYDVHSGRSDSLGTLLAPKAVGGKFDDTWLADAFVDEASGGGSGAEANPRFRQISDLNGIFLDIPSNGSGQTLPLESALSTTSPSTNGNGLAGMSALMNANGGTFGTVLNVANGGGYENRGVDADGDGILDSRWTWAPEDVRQIGALTYVVAYRIIDLSSMINVNVATGNTSTGTGTTTARGYFPTDQNLSRAFGLSRTGYISEITPIHTQRALGGVPLLPGTVAVNASPVTFTGRELAWESQTIGAKYYGYTNNRYGNDDELEMRARGGLNTATATPLELAAPSMLRHGTTEADYKSIPNVSQYNDGWSTHAYFHGGHWDMATGHYPMTDANRKYWATRHWFTTMSGASLLAPQHANLAATSFDTIVRMPYDLVYRYNPDAPADKAARIQGIRDRLYAIFRIGDPKYLGLSSDSVQEQIATEFALNIQDYSDKDGKPSKITLGSVDYYGMEQLPFLREFYVEAQYQAKDTDSDPATYEEWEPIPNSVGFAVEIGNPFDKAIKFGGADGPRIKIAVMQGNTEVYGFVIPDSPTTPELPASDGSLLKEQMVFHSSGSGATISTANSKGGANIAASLGLPGGYTSTMVIPLPADVLAATINGQDLHVELQVETETAGTYVTYDRLRPTAGDEFRLKLKETGTGTLQAPAQKEYKQMTIRRDGENIRYISNKGRQMPAAIVPQTGGYQDGTNYAKFGQDAKGATGDTTLDKIQIPVANHRIFSVAELGYIFNLGFFAGDLGDIPSRISGRDGTAPTNDSADTASQSRWFLSFVDGANAAVVPDTGAARSIRLPHASLVLSHFTTLSPRHDGLDQDNNDGDSTVTSGADNEEEQFVPGVMNVNTAPWWLMAMASPIPEPIADIEAYYKKIAEYRDFPSSRTGITGLSAANLRSVDATDRGISNIGELMLIRGTVGTNTDTQRYGSEAGPIAVTSDLRHYPQPDHATVPNNVEYVAQERMSRFQYLASSLSVRSDRYCAYVVIRGYPSTAFNQAPSESLRFYVLLDRSGVVGIDSAVTVFPKTGQKN